MAKIITVASGKGGVGKSTFAINLAKALQKLNKKILLIDGDIGLRSLDILLGLDEMVVYHWLDFIAGDCDKEKPLLHASKNAKLLPAPVFCQKTIEKKDFSALLDAYTNDYDFIIIDSPSGLGGLPVLYSQCSDLITVVTTPDDISARSACSLGNLLIDSGIKADGLRLVINKFEEKKCRRGQQLNIDELIDKTYIRLLGLIPFDPKLCTGSGVFSDFSDKLDCDFAFSNIARRILGEDLPLNL